MEETEDIKLMMEEPKKAINKLSIPIIISNLFMMLNNIIDCIWVAGLGSGPLAAGFVTPLYLALIGFANGLGAGSNSLIARYIGAKKLSKCRKQCNTLNNAKYNSNNNLNNTPNNNTKTITPNNESRRSTN